MSLPILEENARYYKELTAAVDVVERACRLCVDVIFFSSSLNTINYSIEITVYNCKLSLGISVKYLYS